jgi:hypothetical protein
MNRALPLAVPCGAVTGVGVHRLLVPDPFVAVGVAAVYAGVAYLLLAFDLSLLAEAPRFETRPDRLGYAVGLFGVSVSPLAFAERYAVGATAVAFYVWFIGVVAFLFLAPLARDRQAAEA